MKAEARAGGKEEGAKVEAKVGAREGAKVGAREGVKVEGRVEAREGAREGVKATTKDTREAKIHAIKTEATTMATREDGARTEGIMGAIATTTTTVVVDGAATAGITTTIEKTETIGGIGAITTEGTITAEATTTDRITMTTGTEGIQIIMMVAHIGEITTGIKILIMETDITTIEKTTEEQRAGARGKGITEQKGEAKEGGEAEGMREGEVMGIETRIETKGQREEVVIGGNTIKEAKDADKVEGKAGAKAAGKRKSKTPEANVETNNAHVISTKKTESVRRLLLQKKSLML